MNRKMVLVLLGCLSMPCALTAPLTKGSNEIDKVYVHTAPADALERAQLVLYFNREPVVTLLATPQVRTNGTHEVTFMLPYARIKGPAAQAIAQMSIDKQAPYTITIVPVKTPVEGVRVTIGYRPESIALEHEVFDTITAQKGLVFRLYNKPMLEQLKAKSIPLLRIAQYKKPTIIIDPGHGGIDAGAISALGTTEKEVALAVGKYLASSLERQGYTVVLIRSHDEFVALDERTRKANMVSAPALFVSLHANGAPRLSACGIETFIVDQKLFKKRADYDTACTTAQACLRSKHEVSQVFASAIHASLIAAAQQARVGVHNRGIKRAVSQVLLGARMPSVLIEMGFLSHAQEAPWLSKPEYQQLLARAIANGIGHALVRSTSA